MRHRALLAGKRLPEMYRTPFDEIQLFRDRLDDPLHWRKPAAVGVGFQGDIADLLGDADNCGFPDCILDRVMASERHSFAFLTKRPSAFVTWLEHVPVLPNVWLGCSIMDQSGADRLREPMAALAAAGWKTWVSSEPRIGPVDWTGWSFIKQLVTGGESGKDARTFDIEWARADRDWCEEHQIPWYAKQLGSRPIRPIGNACMPWIAPLRNRAGADPAEWPADIRVRNLAWRQPCR